MHFEQTRAWARFHQTLGRRVYSFSASKLIEYNERQNAPAGVIVERNIAGPFTYLEASRSIFPQEKPISEYAGIFYDAGVRVHAVFVRWTPPREFPISHFPFPNLNGVHFDNPRLLIHQVPPRATLMVELLKSEDELLGGMHEKTRYNIRLAKRKGVVVREVDVQDGFEKFWHLMQDSAHRDGIGIHAKEYYKKMLETVRGDDAYAHLFLAEYEGEPLATAILIIGDDTATYLHGGSSSTQRNLMAPYMLQWGMILYAKVQGCRWYDMWGVAPYAVYPHGHAWAGITRFKMGFGGAVQEGAGTFDIICKPFMYRLLSLGRYVKNLYR